MASYVADRMERCISFELVDRQRLQSCVTWLSQFRSKFGFRRTPTNQKKMQQDEETVTFSKLNLLASCGLLDRKFNFETLQFESSLRHLLWSYLVLIVQETYILSLYWSTFFEREDPIQLLIGSLVRNSFLNHH